MKLEAGDRLDPMTLETLAGAELELPNAAGSGVVHLQFRRFSGCPICNLHLRAMARRVDELRGAGVRSVVFFQSDAATMREYQGELPFDVVADPNGSHYRRFGVERSWWAMLHPRTAWGALKGMFSRGKWSLTRGAEGDFGTHAQLPADFLVDAQGVVLAAKYGAHADDQWDTDELLRLARALPSGGGETAPVPAVSA